MPMNASYIYTYMFTHRWERKARKKRRAEELKSPSTHHIPHTCMVPSGANERTKETKQERRDDGKKWRVVSSCLLLLRFVMCECLIRGLLLLLLLSSLGPHRSPRAQAAVLCLALALSLISFLSRSLWPFAKTGRWGAPHRPSNRQPSNQPPFSPPPFSQTPATPSKVL